MAFDTGAPNTSLLTTYLIKKFIPTLERELQYQKFTTKATIPAGQGKIGRFNLFNNPPGSATALSEGTNTGNVITTLTTAGTDCTIEEFGEFISLTNLMDYAAVQGTRNELANRMGYGGALSLDTTTRDGQSSGTGYVDTTTDFYATLAADGGNVGATAAVTAGSAATIIGAAKLLRDNSALGFSGISGHPDGHFAAIISPQFELDMVTEENSTNSRMAWSNAVTQVPGSQGQTKWVNGFMGSVYGTAVYRTQNFTNTTVTIGTDNNYVVSAGGIGAVDIGDMDAKVFINTASAGDIGNPYRNSNTVAWHAHYGCGLVDSSRVVRVYSAT